MRLKIFLIVFALLFIVTTAFALNITTEKKQYLKGEVISFEIDCQANAEFMFALSQQQHKIISITATCPPEGKYSYKYPTTPADPSGEWNALAVQGSKQAEIRTSLLHVPTSAYYVLNFLSPVAGQHERTKTIRISVLATDASTPVDDAQLFFWGVNGEKLMLTHSENGIYLFDYEIPYDTELKEWELLATADKIVEGQHYGGENRINIEIIKAPISIKVLEPLLQTYKLGLELPILIEARYFNGKPLQQPTLTAQISSTILPLVRIDDLNYQGSHLLGGEDFGALTITITAIDAVGNSGTKSIEIVTTGWFEWFISVSLPYMLALAVAVIAAILIFRRKMKSHLQLMHLRRERQKLTVLLEKLQHSYFEKGCISRKEYSTALAEYKSKLADINRRIAGMEKSPNKSKKP